MRRSPIKRRAGEPAAEILLLEHRAIMLDNPLYRTGEDREHAGHSSSLTTGTTAVLEEQQSKKADPDYDYVAEERAKSALSSNPVYGLPTAGTPHEKLRNETVEREEVSASSSPPYRSVRRLEPPNGLPPQRYERRAAEEEFTYHKEPHYDLPEHLSQLSGRSKRPVVEDSGQTWVPTSQPPVLTRYRSVSTKESDNMLYETSDKHRSAVLYKEWTSQQRWRWRIVYAVLLLVFILSCSAVGLAVKVLIEGCSCESGQPVIAGVTGAQTLDLHDKIDIVNRTLTEKIGRIDKDFSVQDVQIADTIAVITSVNNSLERRIDELGSLTVGPQGPAGVSGPQGSPGKNGTRGPPGISECKTRSDTCSQDKMVSRECTTPTLAPTQGYDVSGVVCSPGSKETYTRMLTSTVNQQTAYQCECMLPIVTQTGVDKVECYVDLWECKTGA